MAEVKKNEDAAKTDVKDKDVVAKSNEVTNPEAVGDSGASQEDGDDAAEAESKQRSFAADKAYEKEVNDAVRAEQIKREVNMRLAQSGALEGAIDTKNPYGLKPGEKVYYEVAGQMVDCNGVPKAAEKN